MMHDLKQFNWVKWIFLGGCLFLLIALQFHNLSLFPVHRGFDAAAHIEYIELIKTQHRVPLANEGWELYQPPFYYALASLGPTLKAAQYLNLVFYLLLIVISWYFFHNFFDDDLSIIGSTLLAALPVLIYMVPPLGNELFANVLIMILLMAYLNYKININQTHWPQLFIIGLLSGLAILTKATGLLAVGLIVIDLLISHHHQLRFVLKQIIIVLSLAMVIGGWFYFRNLLYFHHPLMASADFIPLSSFAQPIVKRTIPFLIDPSSFWKLDLFKAADHSLPGGTYFSFFFDSKNVLSPVLEFSKAGTILTLFSYPLVAISILGLIKSWRDQDPSGKFLSIYAGLLWLAYVFYNFKIPLSSTVKGSFVMSLALPYVYLLLFRLKTWPRTFRLVGAGYLFVYVLISLRNFWILPGWQM